MGKNKIMKRNLYLTLYSIVTLIGLGCFGVGLSCICGYLAGKEYLTRWLGTVPMAFSTALCVMFLGLAIFLIGKNHLNYVETNGQV